MIITQFFSKNDGRCPEIGFGANVKLTISRYSTHRIELSGTYPTLKHQTPFLEENCVMRI